MWVLDSPQAHCMLVSARNQTSQYYTTLLEEHQKIFKHRKTVIILYMMNIMVFTPGCAIVVMTSWLIPKFSLMVLVYDGRENASAPWARITVTST